DEVRHAEVCRRIACALLGDSKVPRAFRGVPDVPLHANASASERVLFHVVEMCCLSETFTGVYFTEALPRTKHPAMRAAIESLLQDEIDHGRVGWAYLACRVRDGTVGGLSNALPDMLDRVVGRVMNRARVDAHANDDDEEALGTLGDGLVAEIF